MRLRSLIAIMAILCLSSVTAGTSGAQENVKQWNCFQKIHDKALTTAIALSPTQVRYALIPFYDSMIDEVYKTEYNPAAYQDRKKFDNLYEAAVFEAHKRQDLKNDYMARLMTDLTMYIVQKYYPGRLGGFCEELTFLRYAPVFYGGYEGFGKETDFTRYAPIVYGGYDKKPGYSNFKNVFFSDNHTDTPVRYTGDMLRYYNKAVNEIVNLWTTVWNEADRDAGTVIETYTLVNPEDVTPFNQKEPKILQQRDDLGLFVYEQTNKPETVPYSGYRAVYEVRDDEGMFVFWENSKLEKPEDYTEIYDIKNRRGFYLYRQRYKLIRPLRVFSSMLNARDYAFNALENRKYYESAAIFGTLIDRKSTDPEMYYGLGMALFNIDDYISSLVNFSKAGAHWDSLYYVGLISEYLARKAPLFDEKMSLIADSVRAYETYGKQKHAPDAVNKSKSLGIMALRSYEKEIEAVISEIIALGQLTQQRYKEEANVAAEKGLDKNTRLNRLETQAGLERIVALNNRYQSITTDLNAKYPDTYAPKSYEQGIKNIEGYVNGILEIDAVIADKQQLIEKRAKAAARVKAENSKDCKDACNVNYAACKKGSRDRFSGKVCFDAFAICIGNCN